jgi:TolB-like protein
MSWYGGATAGADLLYRFEDYVLDTGRRELRRGLGLVPIEPQVFDLLECLIRNRDRVVSKDDLLRTIWSGRIVSESALTTCINAARTAVSDSGEAQRLIRTLPRKGLRFVGEVREQDEPAATRIAASTLTDDAAEELRPNLTVPDRPSIAVLPFANMSDDREQEYFADGIVEEIITALSRFQSFLVIARNSSFTYKGRAVDVKQVGRELGVRYLLEGSVRKAANRVRITGQLVDTSTGVHLWADRFDGPLEDIFELQDQVMSSVVGAVAPTLVQAEIERAKGKPTESLDAYDFYLRGLGLAGGFSNEENTEALRLLYKAIELDPSFATAHGVAAGCYVWRHVNGWTTDHRRELPEIVRLATRAAEFGKNDAVALSFGGVALARIIGDLEGGIALIDRALVLNPNLATAWNFSGWTRAFLGEIETVKEHSARVMRLSPLDPLMHLTQMVVSLGYFIVGRYPEASAWAQKALREQPKFLATIRLLAASKALSGHIEQARDAIEHARKLDPNLHISNLKDRIGPFRPDDFLRYETGLRLAGLPE